MQGVGEVLAHYCTRKQFPMYGFGGIMPNGAVSHCFPLNGDANNPEAEGVQGLMEVYRWGGGLPAAMLPTAPDKQGPSSRVAPG
jgi:hypothetical protein